MATLAQVLVLLAPAALLACGGGGSPAQPVGPGNTTYADAQSDAATASEASLPDGQCPAMFPPTCQAGQTCMLQCNRCTCEADAGGLWACTTKGCPPQGDL